MFDPWASCRITLFALMLTIMSASALANDRIDISILAYHNKPPYIVDIETEQGLYFDFVHFLNERGGDYHFSLKYMPRNRVQQLMNDEHFDGVILGVNPLWFNDQAQTKYLWSDAIFIDEDIFVSLKENPFEYDGSASLYGKQVCLVLGNYYAGISEEIAALRLLSLHTSREIAIFDLLKRGRCDFGVVSRSNYRYRLEHKDIQDQYYISKKVHDRFDRKALFARAQLPVYLFIEEALKNWAVVDIQ